MKVLIVGRSGVGKDTLAAALKPYGMDAVKSYTTRPKRFPEEDTHIFITPKEAANFTDRVATTTINGYEYFSTRQQVEQCGVYIIDSDGVKELLANMPDTPFLVVYIRAKGEHAHKMAVARESDTTRGEEIYQSRITSEDAQFSLFEDIVLPMDTDVRKADFTLSAACMPLYGQEVALYSFVNDYRPDTMKQHAKRIAMQVHAYDKGTIFCD